ncbi:MAG: DUF4328 domain-containing protein [Bacteroidia bacterium]|nr:DUF4328 domain-containing protein [Bacteroidia bacterium]
MNNLKPNEKRAKNAIVLIWIVFTLDIASLISGYMQYNLLTAFNNGAEISAEAANSNDIRERVINILYLIAYLISSITFILWFRRAYYNLHQRVSPLSNTEGWAAGAWFVPIISLFKPYQIMKELYIETKALLSKKGITVNINLTTINVWWTIWIINNFIGQFVFRYSLKATSIDELITSTVAGMINNSVGIFLAIITVKVIHDYSSAEPLLNEIKDENEPITTIS